MKIIHNSIIPFTGYKYINLFGFLFTKNKVLKMKLSDYIHESIHSEQYKELLYIFFLLWYILEWLIKIPFSWFYKQKSEKKISSVAYRSISFEQEAYYNQYNEEYLNKRKRYNWIKYVFKMYDPSNEFPQPEEEKYIEL